MRSSKQGSDTKTAILNSQAVYIRANYATVYLVFSVE